MTKLEAVNIILRAIGERPVTSLAIEYPTLNTALPALDEALLEIQASGWWFNTQYNVEFATGANGEITLSSDVINFFIEDRDLVFNGARVVHGDTGEPATNSTLRGRLVTLRDFEDLPLGAQYATAYHAAHQVYVADHGQDNSSQDLAGRRDRYLFQMGGDHTRTRRVNSRKDSSRVQRWYRSLRT